MVLLLDLPLWVLPLFDLALLVLPLLDLLLLVLLATVFFLLPLSLVVMVVLLCCMKSVWRSVFWNTCVLRMLSGLFMWHACCAEGVMVYFSACIVRASDVSACCWCVVKVCWRDVSCDV